MTKRVYVTSRIGRRIAGLGSRQFGEYFEVDADGAKELLKMAGFSDKDPNAPESPKTTSKRSVPEPAEDKKE